MVLTQPKLPRTAWRAEVDKMRESYKAPVAAADVPAIVDYLANLADRKYPPTAGHFDRRRLWRPATIARAPSKRLGITPR